MIKPPYPYFGGKLSVSPEVQKRLGKYSNFVDPFFGGGSSLWFNQNFDWDVGKWTQGKEISETVNDMHGFIPNFWRSVQSKPEQVAKYADWPVMECDLHARHLYMVNESEKLSAKLESNPDYYDVKIAGWWLWGMAAWIGCGFVSGSGPWMDIDDELCKLPHLGDRGRGINRKRPHLGNRGRGINRQLPHLGNRGRGQCDEWRSHLVDYMSALQNRLRRVRVCCGDWKRVLGPSPTTKLGVTAVFLDPPYISAERENVYTIDSKTIGHEVWEWCRDNGNNPKLKIALCGYEEDYYPIDGWNTWKWSARGGFSNQATVENDNRHKEIIMFSPHCEEVSEYEQIGF